MNRMIERTTAYSLSPGVVSNFMIGLIEDWYPYTMWFVTVSDGMTVGDEFYYYCYNCTSFL